MTEVAGTPGDNDNIVHWLKLIFMMPKPLFDLSFELISPDRLGHVTFGEHHAQSRITI